MELHMTVSVADLKEAMARSQERNDPSTVAGEVAESLAYVCAHVDGFRNIAEFLIDNLSDKGYKVVWKED